MKEEKRKGLFKGAAVLSLVLLPTTTSSLARIGNHCCDSINQDHHQKVHHHKYGAVLQELPQTSEQNKTTEFSLGIQNPFPGINFETGETFVPEELLNTMPYENLYHGENMSSYCEQPIFVKDYFRNMTEEFPTNNDERNCGYVALSMLLSYYDTYWNSSIIDDKYQTSGRKHLDSLSDQDFISPGIKDLDLPVWNAPWYSGSEPAKLGENPTEQEQQNYFKALNTAFSRYLEQMTKTQNVDQYLISYLYKMGLEAGTLDYRNNPVPTIDFDGLQKVVTQYFSHSEVFYQEPIDECLITLSYSFLESEKYFELQTEDEKLLAIRSEIIDRLKNGQPLILGGVLKNEEDEEGNGHFVIAYEYDEQNDVIYGHTGTKVDGGSRVNIDDLYYRIDSYGWINIDNKIKYSQPNPRFEVDGAPHDTCDLYSHVHGFNSRFDYGNKALHAIQCPCGKTKYATHVFKKAKKGPEKLCRLCWHIEIDPNWRPGINVF